MKSRCLLQLALLFAAAVLRTQSHIVFRPEIFRSERSQTPETLDQVIVKSLRSNNPSDLEVALHALSFLRMGRTSPTYWTKLSSRARARARKAQVSSYARKTRMRLQNGKSNKGYENTKYNKWQNIKFYEPRSFIKFFTTWGKKYLFFSLIFLKYNECKS